MLDHLRAGVDESLYDASKMVVNLLQDDFEPITPEEIAEIEFGERVIPVYSGSIRFFDFEEAGVSGYAEGIEMYCLNGTDENKPFASHVLGLQLNHPRIDYSFVIDLESGKAQIESDRFAAAVRDERYPATRRRILRALAAAADQLL